MTSRESWLGSGQSSQYYSLTSVCYYNLPSQTSAIFPEFDLQQVRDHLGRTLLHHAALRGHVGPMRLLLEAGARIEEKSGPDGCVPLHSAAIGGHLEAGEVGAT